MNEARRTADVLIAKAREDVAAASALAERPEIADAIIGFHAQQAVEKALKAVLSARGIAYEFRHDIAYLCELLAADGVDVPDEVTQADVLTPWAAEFRYADVPWTSRWTGPRPCAWRRRSSNGRRASSVVE